MCSVFSYITDKAFNNNVTFCEANVRNKHIFKSNGHIVDVQMRETEQEHAKFLLKYEGKTTIMFLCDST